jgi:uncharacterized protein (TIGR03382 family)
MFEKHKHTAEFLGGVAISVFSLGWIWAIDAMGLEGTFRTFVLYAPVVVVWAWAVWVWVAVFRRRHRGIQR